MGLLKKLNSILEKIGLGFIIVGYGTMTVVTLIEVLRRYFFGMSFDWSEELVRFLLIATTFIGGAVAYKKGSLVLFDVLLNRLPREKISHSKRNQSFDHFDIYDIVDKTWTGLYRATFCNASIESGSWYRYDDSLCLFTHRVYNDHPVLC